MAFLPTLFFDLDGTLVDSEPGIVNGIAHVFEALRQPVPPREALRAWIGPPMRDSFQAAFGDETRVTQALALYRQRYDTLGWTELTVYPGIPELIEALAQAGHRLAVVTSKNERAARRILGALPFGAAFEEIVGASDDGTRRFKPDLIAEALARLQGQAGECVMIGDRRMDIEGAAAHAMRSIGVLWGFGERDELLAAGAGQVVGTPSALADVLGVVLPRG
ncbi:MULTISPECIES: HAD-IA family hydrolase [Pseudoxanthomonas]|jgi:phosphoglycolate phosphatase|uniref:HAD family hydrolase n=1 Tax=Pseudoxanthomonas winnipegensis TaxID=2480810 RepID=A0A4Q8LFK9_9GAMM|nr:MULTISPECIES: HAD-IA family hydrolase [Pseudoxanthomonas]PZP59845.1 MAG: HAD family hydrolase [Pseudoxanthomonas spadix]TAA28166.1 HAD family hydrolase [Pseudoxanthomonas winnipegensis]TMN20251.1 HAD family hydrolase [Pseudoxanthomonas sp. X-1]UAY73559.1 HAD-IA family hydrolase [Pseudoxanthomonas sp. X-1]